MLESSNLRRRIQIRHPNLFTFLTHLQNTTTDNMSDMRRLRNGVKIRCAKKKRNLKNDTRTKACIERYDAGSHSAMQFLRAIVTVSVRIQPHLSSLMITITMTITITISNHNHSISNSRRDKVQQARRRRRQTKRHAVCQHVPSLPHCCSYWRRPRTVWTFQIL